MSTFYVISPEWRDIEEYAEGALARNYTYGNWIDEVLTMDRIVQADRFYNHANTLGSIVALTDGSGHPAEHYSYDVYGQPSYFDGDGNSISQSAIGNIYLFTGRRMDEETSLYYYRARYYDCVKGRFIQRDPLWYVDGLNVYSYVGARPTQQTDPLGLASCCSCPPDYVCCGKWQYQYELAGDKNALECAYKMIGETWWGDALGGLGLSAGVLAGETVISAGGGTAISGTSVSGPLSVAALTGGSVALTTAIKSCLTWFCVDVYTPYHHCYEPGWVWDNWHSYCEGKDILLDDRYETRPGLMGLGLNTKLISPKGWTEDYEWMRRDGSVKTKQCQLYHVAHPDNPCKLPGNRNPK